MHKNRYSILAHYRVIALVNYSYSEHNPIITACDEWKCSLLEPQLYGSKPQKQSPLERTKQNIC